MAVRSRTTDKREATSKKRGSRMNESMNGWVNEWINEWMTRKNMIWGLIYNYEIDEWMNRVFSLEITFVTFDTIWDLVTKKMILALIVIK